MRALLSMEVVYWEILNGNLVKNLPTNELDWGKKPGDKWEYLSPIRKLMNLEKHVVGKKPPNLMTEDWERKLMTIEERQVVNEKPFDLGGVLGGKPMLYYWGLKRMGESRSRSFDQKQLAETHVQLRTRRL